MAPRAALTHVRHRSALGAWEQVFRLPARHLRPYVRSLEGFDERMPAPLRRVEPASTDVVVVLGWGPPVDIGLGLGRDAPAERLGAFVVGPRTTPLTAESTGVQAGVQINLTPLGARLVGDVPLGLLRGRPIAAEHVVDPGLAAVARRLAALASWPARLDLVEHALGRRLDALGPGRPEVAHAWRLLRVSDGRVPVAELAREVGWSRQRLHARLRHDLGVTPQGLGRVLRFHHALTLLEAGGRGLADAAASAGYYDQAHLNRDFRAFTGTSPARHLAARLPDHGGVRAG